MTGREQATASTSGGRSPRAVPARAVPGRASIVMSIVGRDFIEFSRAKLYMGLSIIGLVLYIAVFWLVPDTVNETVAIGLAHHGLGPLDAMLADGDGGLDVVVMDSDADLRSVIAGERVAHRAADGRMLVLRSDEPAPDGADRLALSVGISFPERFIETTVAGEPTTVNVYVNDDTPAEIRTAMRSMIREIAFMVAGSPLPVTEPEADEVVLGVDRMGAQVSMRERMRPLLAFFVLMVETFALASLIASEITHRTVIAVVATPARPSDVLAAKSIHGILLAFAQAVVLLAAIGSFTAANWLPLSVAALIGAAMFTAIAMIAGASGRDFLGTLFYSMVFIVPLAIPAFSAIVPGSSPAWVRFVPSYGVMRMMVDVTSYGAGWGDILSPLLIALVWLVVLFAVGTITLSRKVARL